MPDLHDLDHFDEGLPVNPLPASEVRRRGDRLRRRNNALATVAGLAAVAVIAVPFAVTGRGTDGSAPDPAQPPSSPPSPSGSTTTEGTAGTAWLATIPASFPLTEGMPPANGDGSPVTVRAGYRAQAALAPCGSQPWSPAGPVPALSSAQAVWTDGSEGLEERTLALYDGADSARQVIDTLADRLVAGCGAGEAGLASEELPSDLGEESLVYVDRQRDGAGYTGAGSLFQVVQVGNALLVGSTTLSGAGDESVVDDAAQAYRAATSGTVSSMCVFSADPCESAPSAPDGSASTAPPTASDPGSVIPADFPIGRGIPGADGQGSVDSDSTLDGPSATADGVGLPERFCGASLWPASGVVDRLAVSLTGPEYARIRELAVFETTDQAVAVVGALRQNAADCPDVPGSPSAGGDLVFTDYDLESGYDAATFAQTFTAALGGDVYQFVRVGHAVLATYDYGESAPENVAESARSLNRDNKAITAEMCLFTRAGC